MGNDALEDALHGRGLRVTDERRAVYRVLREAGRPLRRAELVEALRDDGIGAATAYRAIGTFVEAGVVQPINLGGDVAYELLPPHAAHHHHFHCILCGDIRELQVANCGDLVLEGVDGSVLYHQVEAYGVCSGCASARARGSEPTR